MRKLRTAYNFLFWVLMAGWGGNSFQACGAEVMSQFGYCTLIISVKKLNGTPVAGMPVYGWAPELNLLWPRRDDALPDQDGSIWQERMLGKTGEDGTIKAVVPPGKWGFFAAGTLGGGAIMATWADFAERTNNARVNLVATCSKRWGLCAHDGTALAPKRVFFRPSSKFPIWIPVNWTNGSQQIQKSGGDVQMWAHGDAMGNRRGFALNFGTLSDQLPDGNLKCPEQPGIVGCRGGRGRAVLCWAREKSYGVEGEIALGDWSDLFVSPGSYTLAYRRPVSGNLVGIFTGQRYGFESGQRVDLKMNGFLASSVDDCLTEPDKRGHVKVTGRLYLIDGNGHTLAGISNPSGLPVGIKANVCVGALRYPARELVDEDESGLKEAGQTIFTTTLDAARVTTGAMWEFVAPPGMMTTARLVRSERVLVASESFKAETPKAVQAHAQNVLRQADELVAVMNSVAGRERRLKMTSINVLPGRRGASASSSGATISMGTRLFFEQRPTRRHGFVHDLAHNFGLSHGGLMETVIEASRAEDGFQLSQQPAKWMFFDRANGVARKEVLYPNTGLYLYAFAQGGSEFLQFMLEHEANVRRKLSKAQVSNDEITAALLGLALKRDVGTVCAAYGLKANPARLQDTIRVAEAICREKK